MNQVIINKKSKFIKDFENIMNKVIKYLKIKENGQVNIIIINDKKMRKISNQYKKVDKTTDVLSFPADWKKLQKLIKYNMYGDIYISKKRVKQQAKKYNHSLKREWSFLFLHGLLHLLGYDHKTKSDESKMNKICEDVLNKLNINRNL